jgi:hypothetical protein
MVPRLAWPDYSNWRFHDGLTQIGNLAFKLLDAAEKLLDDGADGGG